MPVASIVTGSPCEVDAVHPRPERPRQVGVGAGHRQAALLGDLLGRLVAHRGGQGQRRVDDVADDVLAVGVRAVDDEDPGVDADLVGRQPHAVGRGHAREHVQQQPAERPVELGDRGARRGAAPGRCRR